MKKPMQKKIFLSAILVMATLSACGRYLKVYPPVNEEYGVSRLVHPTGNALS